MLTWIAVKTFFKKAWAWIKEYWKIPALLAYTLLMWVFFRSNSQAAQDILNTAKESHKKQVDVLNTVHKEEIEKRNKALERYNEIVKNLESEFAENEEALSEEEKREIKKIVEEHGDNTKDLAKMISERFGLQYVGKE